MLAPGALRPPPRAAGNLRPDLSYRSHLRRETENNPKSTSLNSLESIVHCSTMLSKSRRDQTFMILARFRIGSPSPDIGPMIQAGTWCLAISGYLNQESGIDHPDLETARKVQGEGDRYFPTLLDTNPPNSAKPDYSQSS